MIVYIFYGIALVFALPLIAAFFIKKDYIIERAAIINRPVKDVFDYIKYLKNQQNYNKWVMMDPHLRKDFKGTDGTVGFLFSWEGNKQAGKGEQEITEILEGKKLNTEIRFKKPFPGIAHTHMTVEPITENQTRIIWGMKGQSKYPKNLMNLLMDKLLGKDIEISLKRLKSLLEEKQTVESRIK